MRLRRDGATELLAETMRLRRDGTTELLAGTMRLRRDGTTETGCGRCPERTVNWAEDGLAGGKELAEKVSWVRKIERERPSAAKAAMNRQPISARMNSCPFKIAKLAEFFRKL
jgi:hypothetical protein